MRAKAQEDKIIKQTNKYKCHFTRFHIWKCQCTNIKFNGNWCRTCQFGCKFDSFEELLDVDGQHPVGGGEDDGGDGEAESQGSCNSNFL